MSEQNTYDVVIVGAGVAGAQLALKLAKQGLKVAVLAKDLDRASSLINNGQVHLPDDALKYIANPVLRGAAIRELVAMQLSLAERAEALAGSTFDPKFCGQNIDIAQDKASAAYLQQSATEQQAALASLGVSPERFPQQLNAQELRLKLGLADSFACEGGVLWRHTGFVDAAAHLRGLQQEARDEGVDFYDKAPLESITLGASDVTVKFAGGQSITADRAVLCMGAATEQAWQNMCTHNGLAQPPRFSIPIYTHCVITEPISGVPPRYSAYADATGLLTGAPNVWWQITDDGRVKFGAHDAFAKLNLPTLIELVDLMHAVLPFTLGVETGTYIVGNDCFGWPPLPIIRHVDNRVLALYGGAGNGNLGLSLGADILADTMTGKSLNADRQLLLDDANTRAATGLPPIFNPQLLGGVQQLSKRFDAFGVVAEMAAGAMIDRLNNRGGGGHNP